MPKAARMCGRTGSSPIAETSQRLRAKSRAVARGLSNVDLGSDLGRRIELERAADPDARDLVMRGWALRSLRFPQLVLKRLGTPSSARSRLTRDPSTLGSASRQLCWDNGPRMGQPSKRRFSTDRTAASRSSRTRYESLECTSCDGNSPANQVRLNEAKVEFEPAIALDHSNARAFSSLGISRYGSVNQRQESPPRKSHSALSSRPQSS